MKLYLNISLAWILVAAIFAGPASVASAAADPPGQVSVRAAWSHDHVQPGDEVTLAVELQIAPGFHINPDAAQVVTDVGFKPYPTRVRVISASDGIVFESPRFPSAHAVSVAYASGKMMAFSDRVRIYLPARIDRQISTGAITVNLEVAYQACDDKVCLFPETVRLVSDIAVRSEGPPPVKINPELFETYVKRTPQGIGAVGFDLFGWQFSIDTTSGLGLIGLLLTAAFGGLLLNFTPCVLPLIPIKIISLSEAAANRRRCLSLGAAMSAGVVSFWLVLGAAIGLISGFTATNQLFQYPLFTIAVGVIIAVMAFGMCGLFSVRLPNFVYMINPSQETHTGSFVLGILAAILSTPCTAPFMGAAAAWAATRHPLTTLATFAAIGIGMALPYLVLSASPGLVKKMPRSGPASVLIKEVMGLFMLGAAAYFIGSAVSALLVTPPNPPGKWFWWIVMGFVASGGFWLAYRTWRIASAKIIKSVFVTLGVLVVAGASLAGIHLTDQGKIDWIYYTPQQFQSAQADGKTIVMVFTAEWCLNCKALEQGVFNTRKVAAVLNADDVAAIKVDITGNNPAGKARLKETGNLTIPLLVIYDAGGNEIFKSDFYTPDQVIRAVDRARDKKIAATKFK